MKKQYIEPTVLVVNVKTGNLMLIVSGEMTEGTADSRSGGSSFFDDDED